MTDIYISAIDPEELSPRHFRLGIPTCARMAPGDRSVGTAVGTYVDLPEDGWVGAGVKESFAFLWDGGVEPQFAVDVNDKVSLELARGNSGS